jgi:hypothetical protein
MKSKLPFFLLLAILSLKVGVVNSQEVWTKLQKNNYASQKKEVYQKKNFPLNYEILSIDLNTFSKNLKSKSINQKEIIELPNATGVLSKYYIKETSNFEANLQAKFPNIRSYSAQGIDDPTSVAKISIGTDGFHAVIFSGDKETVYVDPYSRDNKDLIVYKKSSLSKVDQDFKCQVEETAKKEISSSAFSKNADDGKLRTFRLALTCSGEYAQFHLGSSQQNIADSATDAVKKEAVLSAMNTSITRINGIFEKDLSVKLVLVNDNEKIIFLDAATDDITDGDPDTMINEVQTICDSQIGNANYDIGHVFSIGGDGLAGLGVVCSTGQKARGVTGRSQPVGDPYDIDFVVHELGHQFGATHTQNNDCNRTNSTAVEPGSGSTIMGYAGICTPNVQSGNSNGNSDDYFHAVSIAQMWATIESSASCATITDTGNNAPIANAGLDYSIPKSTPFKLTGTATDEDGLSSLTYNWEQLDNEVATMPPSDTNSNGPMFRSLPSKISPVRYMPDIATVISGSTSSTWEVVPSVARDLNFSFLVRDNHSGGGSSDRDDMKVEVIDADAFIVTSQGAGETFTSGESISISWNVGSTNVAPIDCQNVNIKLSIDGGVTFPILLKTNTPNDGVEDIIVPDNPSVKTRIMVEAADNIFYNVNASDFIIMSSTPTFLVTDNTGGQSVCNIGNQSISYTLNFNFINGFTETATLSSSGNPAGSTVTFNPTSINADGDVIVTVSNLDDIEAKTYDINIVSTSATVSQNVDLVLSLKSSTFNTLSLSSPVNDASDVSLTEVLSWVNDDNASSYDIEVASDVGFQTIVSSGNVNENLFNVTNLDVETQYFWRVKPKNDCGEGSFSDVFNFTTGTPEYCVSIFTDESGGSEHITNVTFAGIDNTSGNDTLDGYEDFTSINANVLRGQTKEISVTLDTAGFQDHCYVFIDWNNNFVFDNETERYDLGTITDDVGTASFNITVPGDAKYGKTRMRVLIEYDDPTGGFGEGACDVDKLSEWGETEDYSITVVASVSVLTTSESCVGENDGIINVDFNQSEFTSRVTVFGPSIDITEDISGTNYMLEGLSPGSYEVCLYVEELNYMQCFEVSILASEDISLEIVSKQPNTYSFNINSGTAPFEVYLNDDLLTVSDQSEFDVEISGSGKLEVKTAKDCEGFFKTSIGEILLKQNPISESIDLILPLFVSEPDIEAVIFDIQGKMIYNQLLKKEGSNLSIPFNDFAAGVYILKLSIENSKPIKILKK